MAIVQIKGLSRERRVAVTHLAARSLLCQVGLASKLVQCRCSIFSDEILRPTLRTYLVTVVFLSRHSSSSITQLLSSPPTSSHQPQLRSKAPLRDRIQNPKGSISYVFPLRPTLNPFPSPFIPSCECIQLQAVSGNTDAKL